MREIQRTGLKPACVAAGLSTRTARKWLRRFCQHGATGLIDRSSRPQKMPQRTCAQKIKRALGLRKNQGLTDNGSAYRSKRFTKRLRRLKFKHKRTRP